MPTEELPTVACWSRGSLGDKRFLRVGVSAEKKVERKKVLFWVVFYDQDCWSLPYDIAGQNEKLNTQIAVLIFIVLRFY